MAAYSEQNPFRETMLLEKHNKQVSQTVFGIQKRFDTKVAQIVGYEGRILDVIKKGAAPDSFFEDMQSLPEPMRNSIQFHENARTAFAYETYLHQSEENLEYKISPHDGKIELFVGSNDRSVSMDIKSYGERDGLEAVTTRVKGNYNWGTSSSPTERIMQFSGRTTNMVEVFRMGQERGGLVIAPLVYSDLDESGYAKLDLDQAMYGSGQIFESRISDDTSGVIIEMAKNEKAKKEKFYFPLQVNPYHELLEVSKGLGV